MRSWLACLLHGLIAGGADWAAVGDERAAGDAGDVAVNFTQDFFQAGCLLDRVFC